MTSKATEPLSAERIREIAELLEIPADASLFRDHVEVGRYIGRLRVAGRDLLRHVEGLQEERDEWKDTAVERQKLCDHWAEKTQSAEAEVQRLREAWEQLKPHVWEASFDDKDYEHTDYTRALMSLAAAIASSQK